MPVHQHHRQDAFSQIARKRIAGERRQRDASNPAIDHSHMPLWSPSLQHHRHELRNFSEFDLKHSAFVSITKGDQEYPEDKTRKATAGPLLAPMSRHALLKTSPSTFTPASASRVHRRLCARGLRDDRVSEHAPFAFLESLNETLERW